MMGFVITVDVPNDLHSFFLYQCLSRIDRSTGSNSSCRGSATGYLLIIQRHAIPALDEVVNRLGASMLHREKGLGIIGPVFLTSRDCPSMQTRCDVAFPGQRLLVGRSDFKQLVSVSVVPPYFDSGLITLSYYCNNQLFQFRDPPKSD